MEWIADASALEAEQPENDLCKLGKNDKSDGTSGKAFALCSVEACLHYYLVSIMRACDL